MLSCMFPRSCYSLVEKAMEDTDHMHLEFYQTSGQRAMPHLRELGDELRTLCVERVVTLLLLQFLGGEDDVVEVVLGGEREQCLRR